jgi:hypothetical protein
MALPRTPRTASVSVFAATSANDTYAFMKARLRSEAFVGSPQLHATSANGAFIWSIPSGKR